MPIDRILIQLADLASKIENVRSLLADGDVLSDPPSALNAEDRAHAAAMLGRLVAKKAELEDQLREMMKRKQ